ncbi:MAG: cysteine--tRNA ligase [bacterium]|nr:cysteine--tRNA ligase [bacterium]
MIRIYDTLKSESRDFSPVSSDNTVRMYTCGMTVQDTPHLGHLRALVTADIIKRTMALGGYRVFSVYNFTDIDDKLIEKMRGGEDYRILSQRNIDEFMRFAAIMNALPFDVYPRATGHIQEIVEFIEKLIEKGYAYKSEGDVFFSVSKFDGYGKLSKKKTDELIEGKRIEINEKKENPLDFVLWKGAKDNEPYWHSPFGKGRPGWHIECSAMSMKYLGETFDIHTGGEDLIFPHHENEIAQSECATGKLFANFWIHNGMVNRNGEKMSKSVGNDSKVKGILSRWSPDVVRLYLMKTHYRKVIEFSPERLDEAKSAYSRIANALDGETASSSAGKYYEKFKEALFDDFNTPQALGVIFDAVNEINAEGCSEKKELRAEIGMMLFALGFKSEKKEAASNDKGLVELLIEVREDARKARNFALSDLIRDRLKEMGIVLNDSKEGVKWKREG